MNTYGQKGNVTSEITGGNDIERSAVQVLGCTGFDMDRDIKNERT